MSYTYQRFMGQIVITSWENDTIEWSEDNGSGGVNVSATIPPAPSVSGAYYPSVLAAEIASRVCKHSSNAFSFFFAGIRRHHDDFPLRFSSFRRA